MLRGKTDMMMTVWEYAIAFFLLLLLAVLIIIWPVTSQPLRYRVLVSALLVISSCTGYWLWGSWDSLLDYQRQQATQIRVNAYLKTVSGPDALIEKMKRHLTEQPKSAQGWYLLGRLYASQNRWGNACDAFQKAHQLEAKNEAYTVNYIQALWQSHHQQFDATIETLIQSVMANNPNQPDVLALQAMNAFKNKDYKMAIDVWSHLLEHLPSDSEDAIFIRKAIARAQRQSTE